MQLVRQERRWSTDYGLVRLCVRESGEFAVQCPSPAAIPESEELARYWAVSSGHVARWDTAWSVLKDTMVRVGWVRGLSALQRKRESDAEREKAQRAALAARLERRRLQRETQAITDAGSAENLKKLRLSRREARKQRKAAKTARKRGARANRAPPKPHVPTPDQIAKKRRSECIAVYSRRNRIITRMGYADYAAYLDSPLWATIRQRVFVRDGRCCAGCGGRATQVHHRDYDANTMAGDTITGLLSVCHDCHEEAEMTPAGEKQSPSEANAHLDRLASLGRTRQIELRRQRRGQGRERSVVLIQSAE